MKRLLKIVQDETQQLPVSARSRRTFGAIAGRRPVGPFGQPAQGIGDRVVEACDVGNVLQGQRNLSGQRVDTPSGRARRKNFTNNEDYLRWPRAEKKIHA